MKNKKEPTYEDLKEKYSDEEIAESFVFPSTMTDEEKKQADEEFRKLRFESLKNMSEEQILRSQLFRVALLMEDYFKLETYVEGFSFSNQLANYAKLIKKKQTDFAKDIDLHTTKLSRILNDRENPNVDLMYRLEHHSGGIIPATYWYRLHTRKLEESIRTDHSKRKEEYKRVKNALDIK